jgi:ATP-binding protein involved in chromosome partitioning
MPVTHAQVIDALRPVEDPELHRSIVELGMVKDVTIADTQIAVLIALTVPGCPLRAEIDNRVTTAIHGLDPAVSVSIDFTVMSEDPSVGGQGHARNLPQLRRHDPLTDRL